jgi:hypothetical protein
VDLSPCALPSQAHTSHAFICRQLVKRCLRLCGAFLSLLLGVDLGDKMLFGKMNVVLAALLKTPLIDGASHLVVRD